MKKLFVSAGLVAIGTAGLHAGDVYAPDFTAKDASRLWSVSGTIRGFYDDNYSTTHVKQGSWGAEVSPSVSLMLPLQQTELGLRYTYGLYYYQQRSNQGQNPFDQTHQADLWIDHAFSERWEGKIQDTFTVAQDPQLTATPTSLPYRATGNNLQNVGTASVHTEWSALFSTDLTYQNQWIHYRQHGATIANFAIGGPTYAGLLNQDSHSISLNLNYEYLPGLMFLVGDSVNLVNYTGGEPVAQDPVTLNYFYSNDRDQFSDQIYVGGVYAITENLNANVQVGASIVDSYNLPSFDNQQSTQVQPYASIAVTYTYLPGDYAQIGFNQSSASTDVSQPSSNGHLTLYQESSVLYASVNHQITPYLLASLIGHYEYSYYVGGQFDGGSQSWYTLELSLAYNINEYLSAQIGYTFNCFTAGNSLPSYTRDVEYIGLTASY